MLKDVISKCVLGEYSQDAAEHRAKVVWAATRWQCCLTCGNDLYDRNTILITLVLPGEELVQRAECDVCFTKSCYQMGLLHMNHPAKGGRVYADSWDGRVSWSTETGESTVEKEFLE